MHNHTHLERRADRNVNHYTKRDTHQHRGGHATFDTAVHAHTHLDRDAARNGHGHTGDGADGKRIQCAHWDGHLDTVADTAAVHRRLQW